MIISHKHKFIFLKTKKTAGSSLEYVLADLCGEEDIITPASRTEEPVRTGRRAQNYWLPPEKRTPLNKARAHFTDTPERYVGFYNHMPAARVRALIGEEIWSSYFKFTFERNPWDRQVSLYYWRFPDPQTRPSFETFIDNRRYQRRSRNWSVYTINDQLAVDRVGRYETLSKDTAGILDRLGLEMPAELPRLKTTSRDRCNDDGGGYRNYYSQQTQDRVGRWYAREIETFGYTF